MGTGKDPYAATSLNFKAVFRIQMKMLRH